MSSFATYLHPETCLTSKPIEQIDFVGHSLPHFNAVREQLESGLQNFKSIPLTHVGLDAYSRVHSQGYLQQIINFAERRDEVAKPKWSMECTGLEFALPGYEFCLGGLFAAVDQMKSGRLERAYCFSLGGHHAFTDWGHGYCILNPQAAAVRYAQEQGFENVIVMDWDHHHGDGTQSIFADDDTVYCVSIHSATDLYMSLQRVISLGTTAAAEETGHCNIPILNSEFSEEDWEQLALGGTYFRGQDAISVLQNKLEQLPWTPDVLMIFSGYDAHIDDCGREIQNWTNDDFKLLTKIAVNVAHRANCPILSVHGGGYQLAVTVSAALAHVDVLAN